MRVPGFGVGVVLPEPSGVPPAEGVTGGRGVCRSGWAPGVPVPGPGAAGVPGLMVTPEPESLREGEVGREAGVRSKAPCAEAELPPGVVDADPGVIPDPVCPGIGGVL